MDTQEPSLNWLLYKAMERTRTVIVDRYPKGTTCGVNIAKDGKLWGLRVMFYEHYDEVFPDGSTDRTD